MVAQNLNGINTVDNARGIREVLYSLQITWVLEPELTAFQWADAITDFPDGDSWEDVEVGAMTVRDYKEGEDIVYESLALGTRRFYINEYKQSNTFITEKYLQDSYISAQIAARIPHLEARAIYVDLEQNLLRLANDMQDQTNGNVIYGYNHRFVAGLDPIDEFTAYGTLKPEDFAYAQSALVRAGYTDQNIAIIPTYQAYKIVENPRFVASLSRNPMWEGIVRDGAISGMRFKFNIYDFDVYISNYTVADLAGNLPDRDNKANVAFTNAGTAIFFSNTPLRRPFRMAWRMMPTFELVWNPHKRREEYITVCRYGTAPGDRPNLVVAVVADSSESTFNVAALPSASPATAKSSKGE